MISLTIPNLEIKMSLIIPNYRNFSESPCFRKISPTIPFFSEVLQFRKISLTIPNPTFFGIVRLIYITRFGIMGLIFWNISRFGIVRLIFRSYGTSEKKSGLWDLFKRFGIVRLIFRKYGILPILRLFLFAQIYRLDCRNTNSGVEEFIYRLTQEQRCANAITM
jgi:hypothetical protein